MALSRAGEVFINGVVPDFEENRGNSLCNVSEWFWSQFAQRIDGQTFCNVSPALAGMETTALKPSRKVKAEPPKRLHIDKNYILWLLWQMRDPTNRTRMLVR